MKRQPGFDPYCGPLTPLEVAKGAEAAVLNARDLFHCAQALISLDHFSQSAALAILAMEELQTAYILLDILLAKSEDETKLLWSQYRRHGHKQSRFSKWIRVMAHIEKHPGIDRNGVENLLSSPQLAENVLELRKQMYLYTDNFQNSGWSVPSTRA